MSFRSMNYQNVHPEGLLNAARSKFDSASKLYETENYEDAVYLAGYALEFILKRHICLRLGWSAYPPKHIHITEVGYKNDDNYNTFKTHDLNKLLIIVGLRDEVDNDSDLSGYWFTVLKWKVELRYHHHGDLSAQAAKETLDSILYMIKWIQNKHE